MIMPPLDNIDYLLGILDEGLSIRVKREPKRTKIYGFFSHWDKDLIMGLKDRFGGVISQAPRGSRYLITLNATSLLAVARFCHPHPSKLHLHYQAVIDLEQLRLGLDRTKITLDKLYMDMYRIKRTAILDKLDKEQPHFISVSSSYLRGIEIATAKVPKSLILDPSIVTRKAKEQIDKEYEDNRLKINRELVLDQERAASERQEKNVAYRVRIDANNTRRRLAREIRYQARQEAIKKRAEDKAAAKQLALEASMQLIQSGFNVCGFCDKTLPIERFAKNHTAKTGYSPYCWRCCYDRHHKPRSALINARAKQWRKDNPERTRAIRKRSRQTPNVRVRHALKKRVTEYIKKYPHRETYRSLVGCSPKALVAYLTYLFKPGMTWENYGKIWQIDHIIPFAAFDHANVTHLRWCSNYRNLDPKTVADNAHKLDYLPSGVSAARLKDKNLAALHIEVATMLEAQGIATKQEYMDSLTNAQQAIYIDL